MTEQDNRIAGIEKRASEYPDVITRIARAGSDNEELNNAMNRLTEIENEHHTDILVLLSRIRELEQEKAMKEIAILGGGDWADASVEHVRIPADCDIYKLRSEYNDSDYSGYWRGNVENKQRLDFIDWLKKFHNAADSKVECFSDEF